MSKINKITVTSKNNITVDNLFFKNEKPTEALIVVFPGNGYACDMPLLYYCTEAALQLGYDVINLKYFFQCSETEFENNDADYRQVIDDCYSQLKNNVLNENSYKNIVFASKSLGTIFAGETALLFSEVEINHFFLTPLAGTIPHIEKSACTVVVGKDDNH